MILRNRLKYAILAGVLALASPSKTASSDLSFMVLNLKKFTIKAPLEQRLKLVEGMETESLARIVDYDSFIRAASSRYVSPATLYSMIYQESRGNPRARSPKGEEGLLQITPITQRHLGMKRGEAFDPEIAIAKGTEYYSQLLDYFHGNEVLALAAYNYGQRSVDTILKKKGLNPKTATYENFGRFLNRETRNYIQDVLANREAIKEYL